MLIISQIFNRFSTAIKIGIFKELVRGKVKYGYVEQIPSYKDSFHMVSYPGSSVFLQEEENVLDHISYCIWNYYCLILWQYSLNCQTLHVILHFLLPEQTQSTLYFKSSILIAKAYMDFNRVWKYKIMPESGNI